MTTGDNTQNTQKPTIGFIGTGLMGSEMAQRLIQAGYSVTVYDRTREKAERVAKQGAKVANTLSDVAASSDVVISMLIDNIALDETMYGTQGPQGTHGTNEQPGALSSASAKNIFIDMSSVSPQTSRHLHDAVREKGARMLDAPVSGSTPQAKEGKLVIFVGGDQQTFEQCKPILEVLGQQIHHMGGNGMGVTMKLVVNTMLGLGMQALAEALTLGEKGGLDKHQLVEVLGQTTVVAPAYKAKLQNVEQEQYPVNFALSSMRKDFGLILRLASELSVVMPATAAAEQMYAAALAQGHDEDFSAMMQFMEQMSGIK